MNRTVFALIAALALAPAAVAHAAGVEVHGAWIRLPPNGSTTAAAYLEAVNRTGVPDRLIGASCACAGHAMVHEMNTSGGMMHMREAPNGLPVPAGGALRLAPGGDHVMLMALRGRLQPGQLVPLTLRFARSGSVTVEAEVKP